jgi:methylenetetrahydrofolate dehydrogenase (NADP+)/methenyltetrahydrofolate cyclohydrolase
MTATIIKGTDVAQEIREELKREVEKLKAAHQVTPGLVTILVGEDPASISYVTGKQRTAKELGFYSVQDNQPPDIGEDALLALIAQYNKDPQIHGILVQLPLPKQINETKILYAIDPKKDVDGFHPVNVGKLLIGEPDFLPCTPLGIWQLLIRAGVKIDTHAEDAERECHGDRVSHEDKGYGLSYAAGGHPDRGCRPPQGDNGGYG